MKSFLSMIFVLSAPFLFGAFVPIALMKLGVDSDTSFGWYILYLIIWFWLWADVFDEGRKL